MYAEIPWSFEDSSQKCNEQTDLVMQCPKLLTMNSEAPHFGFQRIGLVRWNPQMRIKNIYFFAMNIKEGDAKIPLNK